MANPVATNQILYDGVRNCVVKATFLSGGLDQAITPLVTVATLQPPANIHLTVTKVQYDITPGGVVRIYWDSPPIPTDMLDLNGFDHPDFKEFMGIKNNGGPNANGNILISTQGFTLNYVYTIVIHMKKNI